MRRTLSKKIKKWLRIFITLDIFYEEIRSFLGILLNCTSLFYVKSFCCWCPIISPIYSAMYVSNVWMMSFHKMGNFPIMTLAAKLMYKLCIIYAFRKINIQHLENHWKMIQLNSKWIGLIKCDLRAKVLEFVQFTMYFFFLYFAAVIFLVSHKKINIKLIEVLYTLLKMHHECDTFLWFCIICNFLRKQYPQWNQG